MEPLTPKNILDWNESDISTLVDTSSEDQADDTLFNQRYEDLDQLSLGVMAKNLSDGIESRTFSLSLAENIDSMDKKKALTQKLEKSINRNKAELNLVKQELDARPDVRQPIKSAYPLPRIVSEFVKDVNLSLLSQILNGSFGENRSEFYQRYLTFIEYCRSYDLTSGQVDQVLRMFLREDMLIFWMDQEPGLPTLEKLQGLLTIFFKGPSISDRLRQLKDFQREESESLESTILRLSLLLDKTETLFPLQHRESRREVFISNAISRLSHPLVRSKVERFKKEVFMSRRFLSSDQLLRKCSEMEIMSGCMDNDPIKLNYEDPFLSNEAKNSLLEREKKPKTEKSVRISDDSRERRSMEPSIRSDLEEVKQILKTMTDQKNERTSGNVYSRYNNRQNQPSRSDFFGRNRFNNPSSNQKQNDWTYGTRSGIPNRPNYIPSKKFSDMNLMSRQPPSPPPRPNPPTRQSQTVSDYHPNSSFVKHDVKRDSVGAEGLSNLTKTGSN